VHRLTKKQARRIAVRAQLLDAPRPKDLLEVVRRLTLLQDDPSRPLPRRRRRDPRRGGGRAGRRRGREGGRVDPAYLYGGFKGRTAPLSPFDRLIHDRGCTEELSEFESTLEMSKPTAKPRWGYFAVPILDGDRLVGKLDATRRP